MAISRELGFWEAMCEILHDQFCGTTTGSIVLRVRGPLDESVLRTGLEAMLRRHPLMRARLLVDDRTGASSLHVDDEPGAPALRVVTRTDDTHWERVNEDELSVTFSTGQHYLWRAVLVRDEGGALSEIILVFHHMIADGLSGVYVARDLLSVCAEIASGSSGGGLPSLPMLPSVDRLMPNAPSGMKYLARALLQVAVDAKPDPIPFQGHAPIEARRTKMIYLALTEDKLSQLAKGCRREKTTIGAALNAALLLAATDVFGMPTPAKADCHAAVSIRDFCEPKIGPDQCGCLVSTVITKHKILPGQEFWPLARECREQLKAGIDRQNFQPKSYRKSILARSLKLLLSQSERRRQFALGYMVSNVGRVDIPQQYGPFHVEEVYIGSARHAGDFALGLTVLSAFGKMYCALAYEAPLVKESSARAIADKIVRILDEATRSSVVPLASSQSHSGAIA